MLVHSFEYSFLVNSCVLLFVHFNSFLLKFYQASSLCRLSFSTAFLLLINVFPSVSLISLTEVPHQLRLVYLLPLSCSTPASIFRLLVIYFGFFCSLFAFYDLLSVFSSVRFQYFNKNLSSVRVFLLHVSPF